MSMIPDNIARVFFSMSSGIETYFSYTRIEHEEIGFDELISIIKEVEKKYYGLGSRLHDEVFTGVDFYGNKPYYDTYNIITDDNILYRYVFDVEFIPFNDIIKQRNRNNIIDSIL